MIKENEIVFAKVKPNAIIPTKEEENAGYDIYPCFEEDYYYIPPHTTTMIPTGIACALHPKWYFQVEERGSTGSKGIKKSAGVVDSGYRGEIFIAITNTNKEALAISKLSSEETLKLVRKEHFFNNIVYYPYEKAIAQLVLHEVPVMDIKEVSYDELFAIPSKRGTGKLGSSGV